MPTKSMVPGRSNVTIDSALLTTAEASQLHELPGGLYPLQTRSYETDEWRVMAGWPVAVPNYDIRANTMVSASGEVFSGRDDNTQVRTGALLRWVADASYYDEVSYTWKPHQDQTGQQVVWTTSASFAPVLLTDYEYRVKDERFVVEALNFDSDSQCHMWADFSSTIGSGNGYTVIMVMSPNSAFGNDIDVPYNGLWCPGRATPVGDTFVEAINDEWLSVNIQGGYLYVGSESTAEERVASISQQIGTNSPMFLAMVFARPETTIYVGSGPEKISAYTYEAGEGLVDDGVVLGRSTGDILHTADMALMDLNLYGDRLTKAQVRNEFALLAGCYGGSA